MPALTTAAGISLGLAALDALIAFLEKRQLQGDALRDEAGDTTGIDEAHRALQAAFAPAGVPVTTPEAVDLEAADTAAALEHLREAAAALRGEA
jgi:hypothetical protein